MVRARGHRTEILMTGIGFAAETPKTLAKQRAPSGSLLQQHICSCAASAQRPIEMGCASSSDRASRRCMRTTQSRPITCVTRRWTSSCRRISRANGCAFWIAARPCRFACASRCRRRFRPSVARFDASKRLKATSGPCRRTGEMERCAGSATAKRTCRPPRWRSWRRKRRGRTHWHPSSRRRRTRFHSASAMTAVKVPVPAGRG